MAESVYLQDGHTGSGAATVFFDATVCDWGSWAQVRSFGIPDWPGDGYTRATDRNYTLQLEVRLKNGKYLPPFMVDITEQVKAQPRGGVIVITGLEVSDEDGESGGSGLMWRSATGATDTNTNCRSSPLTKAYSEKQCCF